MWDLPGPGLEPVSPALAGGFLTTVPPGKPCVCYFLMSPFCLSSIYLAVMFIEAQSILIDTVTLHDLEIWEENKVKEHVQ